jgi:threonyl-tRNA synthetase
VNDEASRDHRDINQDLPVFATDPLAGAGLPLWLPDGAVIREELQRLAKDLARRRMPERLLPGAREASAVRALRPLGEVQR